MGQLLAEAARCILTDEDVAAFNSTWQTLLRKVQLQFFWFDQAQIEDAIGEVILRRLTLAREQGDIARPRKVELLLRSL